MVGAQTWAAGAGGGGGGGGGGHKLAPPPTPPPPPPTIQTSINFRNFAALYLRSLETNHFQIGQFY